MDLGNRRLGNPHAHTHIRQSGGDTVKIVGQESLDETRDSTMRQETSEDDDDDYGEDEDTEVEDEEDGDKQKKTDKVKSDYALQITQPSTQCELEMVLIVQVYASVFM